METASPSAPSEIVGRVLRGSRKMHLDTNINLNENGLEDIDEFWNTAKTPKVIPKTKSTPKKRQPLKQDNRKVNKKEQRSTPRFSLDGNADGDSVGVKIEKFRSKLEVGAISPGDLSIVTTAPPTPKSPEETPEKTPEKARAAVSEVDDLVVANHAASKSPIVGVATMQISPSAPDDDFPMDDDDPGDDDDLLPPPPPDDMHPDEEPEHMTEVDVDFPQDQSISRSRSPQVHEESPIPEKQNETSHDDDDDNEGAGFDMNSPIAASNGSTTSTEPTPVPMPEKKKRGRPRKSDATDDVSAKTPAVPKGKKKQKQATMFSPPGYPVGNRQMNPVPVSDYKESPEVGKRRSRRMRVKPLAYWKNERVVYGPHSEAGKLGDEMGCMPVPMSVLTALPTPRRQRKPATSQPGSKKGRPPHRAGIIENEKPFDDSRLRKKYNYMDGEYAQIWDEGLEDASNEKVVSYSENLNDTVLPLPKTGRKKHEGMVVGRAAQSFNIPSSDNNVFVGYLMGNLKLPPKGIKDPESTGACSQVFTVCSCQPNSVEVAYGDPHEEEGSLSAETAQRFLLSAGDQFRIPPGNAYMLANHSSTTECLLAWTIIRPPKSAESP